MATKTVIVTSDHHFNHGIVLYLHYTNNKLQSWKWTDNGTEIKFNEPGKEFMRFFQFFGCIEDLRVMFGTFNEIYKSIYDMATPLNSDCIIQKNFVHNGKALSISYRVGHHKTLGGVFKMIGTWQPSDLIEYDYYAYPDNAFYDLGSMCESDLSEKIDK